MAIRLMAVVLISLVLHIQSQAADQKKFGIGVILGAPTGLSLKYWTNSSVAIQGAVGGGPGGLVVGADYIEHVEAFTNRSFTFYYGPGVFMGETWGGPKVARSDVGIGVKGVFGVNYIKPNQPFEFSIELGPALLLVPTVGMGVELGVSFRFYP